MRSNERAHAASAAQSTSSSFSFATDSKASWNDWIFARARSSRSFLFVKTNFVASTIVGKRTFSSTAREISTLNANVKTSTTRKNSIVEAMNEETKILKDLSKFRLSMFVVSTSACGCFLMLGDGRERERACRADDDDDGRVELGTKKEEQETKDDLNDYYGKYEQYMEQAKIVLNVSIGTALCAFSANSMNQIIEREQDAKMARTMRRPLPSKRISVLRAVMFSVTSGVSGCWFLNEFCNEQTAVLGGGNILLYAFVYTPLKQVHWVNTWVGAVVGAIPPMMGFTAATNALSFSSSSSSSDSLAGMMNTDNNDSNKRNSLLMKGMVLPLAVYLWQMPHFMALATMGKEDYIKGGYSMLSHPKYDPLLRRVANVALRNSLMLLPLGFIATNVGLVAKDSSFQYEAALLGAPLVLTALLFRQKANITSAKRMFYGSLAYLPLFQLMLCIRSRESITNDDENNNNNNNNNILRQQEGDDDESLFNDKNVNAFLKILMTPVIALHDLVAVDESCPQVALAEDKEKNNDMKEEK